MCIEPKIGVFLVPIVLIFVVVLVVGAFGTPLARADVAEVTMSASEEHARVVVRWTDVVGFETSSDTRETIIRFDRPIEVELPEFPQSELAGWIDSVQTGYDSLLVRAPGEVVFDVYARGTEVVIDLSAASNSGGPEFVSPDGGAGVRLDVLRAQVFVRMRRYREALDLLERLSIEAPGNSDVVVSLAQAELEVGRWRRAMELYRTELARTGHNPGIERSMEAIDRTHGDRFRSVVRSRQVRGGLSESILSMTGAAHLSEGVVIGTDLEQNVWSTEDGPAGLRHGRNRRADTYVQFDSIGGSRFRAGLTSGRGTTGGLLEFERPDAGGELAIRARYGRPYWDLFEGILGNAVRDRIGVERTQTLGRRVDARVGLSANRYRLPDSYAALPTIGMAASVFYSARRENPEIYAGYTVDVERVGRATAETFSMADREVHALTTGTAVTFGHATVSANGGFALDRFGGRGAFGELRFGFDAGPVRLEAWADQSLNAAATVNVVRTFGGALTLGF